MALGKNLKREQLIPIGDQKPKNKGAKTKRSNKSKKANKSTKEQKTANPKSEVTTQKTTSATEPIQEEEVITKTIEVRQRANYITEKEFTERQRIREKFERQLQELANRDVHVVVFSLGAELFALEIDCIKEVVVTPSISKIPYAPEYIKGISNVRGFTMIMINLMEKFKLVDSTSQDGQKPSYSIIVESSKFKAGILVESVPTTMVIQGATIESAGGAMTETSLDESFIKGLIKNDDQMIFLIDIDELIESDKISAVAERLGNK